MKIVACFLAHTEDYWIDDYLADLSKYTDEFYINLNEASEYVREQCESHPNTKKFIETKHKNGRWRIAFQREKALRLLDDVKPDIVLWMDVDTTFPDDFKETLQRFIESDKKCIWFKADYYWNDKCHIRTDGIYSKMGQCLGFKWEPGLTFIPYRGSTMPSNFEKSDRFVSPTPVKHWGYMREEDRLEKAHKHGKNHAFWSKNITLKKVC